MTATAEMTRTSPFSHLKGQSRAGRILGQSLSSGRIAHAYLFRGPDGVGKKLFGMAMASALNCIRMGPESACGICNSCRKMSSGNHPDCIVETPLKGTISIDRIRKICKDLSFPPYESNRRIIIIEDVHTMRVEAANSLLKTLEEPPDGNVLILTAETSKNVLSTISSRCQVVPFFTLTIDETREILTSPTIGLAKEEAQLLAELAEGSPGRALRLHQGEMVDIWQRVVAVLAEEHLNRDAGTGKLLQMAQQMAELKENLVPMLGLLRLWVREKLMLCHINGTENDISGNKDDVFTRNREYFAKLAAIDQAELQLARNCNRALVCEILLFRLQ